MKKLFYLLILSVMPLAFSACHDDDDLPNVDFNIDIENATYADGNIYVVQGDILTFKSINVTNLDDAKKGAMITSAAFYWDGYYIGTAIEPPYGFDIQTTEQTEIGRHSLQIVSPLYAVDKAPATSVIAYTVYVVASPDDMPTSGSATIVDTPSLSK